jgi:hypothetical protein
MSAHYHLLKVANVDAKRLRVMRAGSGLGPGVLIDAAPFSFGYSIVACPVGTDSVEIVRGEVASETMSVDDIRRMNHR